MSLVTSSQGILHSPPYCPCLWYEVHMALTKPLPISGSESGAPRPWPMKTSLASFSREASLLFYIWGVHTPCGVTRQWLPCLSQRLGMMSEDGCGGQAGGA